MAAIGDDPCFKLVERFLAQRVKTLLPIWTHLHDAGLGEDSQVSRNAGLLDVHAFDNVSHGALPRSHRLHDAKASRIGQGMK